MTVTVAPPHPVRRDSAMPLLIFVPPPQPFATESPWRWFPPAALSSSSCSYPLSPRRQSINII